MRWLAALFIAAFVLYLLFLVLVLWIGRDVEKETRRSRFGSSSDVGGGGVRRRPGE